MMTHRPPSSIMLLIKPELQARILSKQFWGNLQRPAFVMMCIEPALAVITSPDQCSTVEQCAVRPGSGVAALHSRLTASRLFQLVNAELMTGCNRVLTARICCELARSLANERIHLMFIRKIIPNLFPFLRQSAIYHYLCKC